MATQLTLDIGEYQVRLPRPGEPASSRRARPRRRTSSARSRRTKDEPEWMLDFRLQALEIFRKKPDADAGAAT